MTAINRIDFRISGCQRTASIVVAWPYASDRSLALEREPPLGPNIRGSVNQFISNYYPEGMGSYVGDCSLTVP
jgi:hypothetical protein